VRNSARVVSLPSCSTVGSNFSRTGDGFAIFGLISEEEECVFFFIADIYSPLCVVLLQMICLVIDIESPAFDRVPTEIALLNTNIPIISLFALEIVIGIDYLI